MLRVLNQISAPMHLIKSDLAICAAGCRCSLFTFKRVWSVALCADAKKMTMPTTTRKICVFFFTDCASFFTELDRSRLTYLDRSTFEKEHNQYITDINNTLFLHSLNNISQTLEGTDDTDIHTCC